MLCDVVFYCILWHNIVWNNIRLAMIYDTTYDMIWKRIEYINLQKGQQIINE